MAQLVIILIAQISVFKNDILSLHLYQKKYNALDYTLPLENSCNCEMATLNVVK